MVMISILGSSIPGIIFCFYTIYILFHDDKVISFPEIISSFLTSFNFSAIFHEKDDDCKVTISGSSMIMAHKPALLLSIYVPF